MDCLICHQPMQHTVHEGVELDACSEGHGMWVDRRELAQMVFDDDASRPAHEQLAELDHARAAGMGAVMDAVHAEGIRQCPVCSNRMSKQQWGHSSAVIVDSCAEHGTWLDGGELTRIEAYAEGIRAALRS